MAEYQDEEKEKEANLFAMCLLMPEEMVKHYLALHGTFDLMGTDDNKRLVKMAQDFEVEVPVLVLRLQQLELIGGI